MFYILRLQKCHVVFYYYHFNDAYFCPHLLSLPKLWRGDKNKRQLLVTSYSEMVTLWKHSSINKYRQANTGVFVSTEHFIT